MDSPLWDRVQDVLGGAEQALPAELDALLDERCEGDLELRREVESLLSASETAYDYFSGLMGRLVDAVEAERPAEWLTPGCVVEGFRVGEKLGAGGMGEVYRATDLSLGRDVALKVLTETLAHDPAQVARFKREARLLAVLNHPSIAAIHGLEEVGERAVLVLELVEGPTLGERLAKGALGVGEVVEIAAQIADALAAAHAAGIVHRDLKPANVKFTREGRVKVLDFGIAKALQRHESGSTDGSAHTETALRTDEAGKIRGTLPYMSPEQLGGGSVGPRTDLWALGVLVYEALTGRRPFDGELPQAIMAAIFEREPDWSVLPGSVPDDLSRLVRRCLRKEPELRPASAAEIRASLESLRSRGARAEDLRQEIRFCTATDGVRIAYATVGSGRTIVKSANWLNHLEYDWDSPVWRHLLRSFAERFRLIRYDERGNGLSDWEVEDLSFDAFVRDLETVTECAAPERFALFGVSQGCAVSVAYSVLHPDRVSHLILLGGYALGASVRGSKEDAEAAEAMATIMRFGWGKDNPAFRQLFTSRMIPGATREQMDWFNELQRITTSPEIAYRLRCTFNHIDVRDLLPKVSVPTLVLHAKGDAAVPFEQGRLLAREIPGARFVPLESDNHLLLAEEPAWARCLEEIESFLGGGG